jgi:hypothetical protein
LAKQSARLSAEASWRRWTKCPPSYGWQASEVEQAV